MAFNVSDLEDLGLTPQESAVYYYLFHNPNTDAGTIARSLKMSQSRSGQIFSGMIKKGLIIFKKDGQRKYYATSEEKKLAEYLDEKNEEAVKKIQKQRENISQLMQNMKAAKEDFVQMQVFESKASFQNYYKNIINKVEAPLYQLINSDLYKNSNSEEKKIDEEKEKRKYKRVNLYTQKIAEKTTENDKIFLPYEDFKDLPALIALVNDDIVVVDLENINDYKYFIIKNKSFSRTLRTVFQYIEKQFKK